MAEKSKRGRKALGDKKKRLTTINLDPETLAVLVAESKKTGKSVASLIRHYIEVGRENSRE